MKIFYVIFKNGQFYIITFSKDRNDYYNEERIGEKLKIDFGAQNIEMLNMEIPKRYTLAKHCFEDFDYSFVLTKCENQDDYSSGNNNARMYVKKNNTYYYTENCLEELKNLKNPLIKFRFSSQVNYPFKKLIPNQCLIVEKRTLNVGYVLTKIKVAKNKKSSKKSLKYADTDIETDCEIDIDPNIVSVVDISSGADEKETEEKWEILKILNLVSETERIKFNLIPILKEELEDLRKSKKPVVIFKYYDNYCYAEIPYDLDFYGSPFGDLNCINSDIFSNGKMCARADFDFCVKHNIKFCPRWKNHYSYRMENVPSHIIAFESVNTADPLKIVMDCEDAIIAKEKEEK